MWWNLLLYLPVNLCCTSPTVNRWIKLAVLMDNTCVLQEWLQHSQSAYHFYPSSLRYKRQLKWMWADERQGINTGGQMKTILSWNLKANQPVLWFQMTVSAAIVQFLLTLCKCYESMGSTSEYRSKWPGAGEEMLENFRKSGVLLTKITWKKQYEKQLLSETIDSVLKQSIPAPVNPTPGFKSF